MTCLEIFSVAKDIALIGAATSGAYVAVKGLNTWRNQLKGQAEYELSRRLLVSLYKYRDEIDNVRHPMMLPHEMPYPPSDEAKEMNRDQIQFYGMSKAYQNRWDKLREQRTALYADLLESEAIWGTNLKEIFQKLFNLQHELFTEIRHHIELSNPATDSGKQDAIRNLRRKKREIMYGDTSEEGDDFKQEILGVVQEIENYLKPKLTHVDE